MRTLQDGKNCVVFGRYPDFIHANIKWMYPNRVIDISE